MSCMLCPCVMRRRWSTRVRSASTPLCTCRRVCPPFRRSWCVTLRLNVALRLQIEPVCGTRRVCCACCLSVSLRTQVLHLKRFVPDLETQRYSKCMSRVTMPLVLDVQELCDEFVRQPPPPSWKWVCSGCTSRQNPVRGWLLLCSCFELVLVGAALSAGCPRARTCAW